MVSLSAVHASNSLISTVLPAGLVAVFVGATRGIGEISVKTFAKYARKPRVYIVSRSQKSADNVLASCTALNAEGEFRFIQADVSLIRGVDELCREIKAKESVLNLLFLSAGVPSMDRSHTLRRCPSLVSSTIDPTDYQALRIPVAEVRSHLTTLVTLGLESVAKTAPDVSIVHDYPGTVKTPFLNHMPEEMMTTLEFVPLDECGERHVYLATSARYPPRNGEDFAIPLGDGLDVARGSTGEPGNGMYSVGKDGESLSLEAREILAGLREKAMVEEIWRHAEAELKRIVEEPGR